MGVAEGSYFNTRLRKTLKDGIERGILEEGSSIQRFKITDLGRKERKEADGRKKYDVADIKPKGGRKKAKTKPKSKAKSKKKTKAKPKAKPKKKTTTRGRPKATRTSPRKRRSST